MLVTVRKVGGAGGMWPGMGCQQAARAADQTRRTSCAVCARGMRNIASPQHGAITETCRPKRCSLAAIAWLGPSALTRTRIQWQRWRHPLPHPAHTSPSPPARPFHLTGRMCTRRSCRECGEWPYAQTLTEHMLMQVWLRAVFSPAPCVA